MERNGKKNGTLNGAAVSHNHSQPPGEHEEEIVSTAKHFIPVRCEKVEDGEMGFRKAGLLSLITCHWMLPLVKKVFKEGKATMEMLWKMPPEQSAAHNSKLFEKEWNKELKLRGPENASVFRATISMMRWHYLIAIFLGLSFNVLAIAGSTFAVNRVLAFTVIPYAERPVHGALLWCFVLFVISGLRTCFIASFFSNNLVAGIRLKGAVLSYLFKKVMSIRALGNGQVGELVNLIANDGQRLFDFMYLGNLVLLVVAILPGFVVGFYLIGWYSFVGITALSLLVPIQFALSKWMIYFRRKAVQNTDERVKLISEILNAIKLIKFYCWEKPFGKKYQDLRDVEARYVTYARVLTSATACLAQIGPLLSMTVTVLCCIAGGRNLSSNEAFSFLTLLYATRFAFTVVPRAVNAMTDFWVSCKRIKKFLLMSGLAPVCHSMANNDNVIEMVGASFAWPLEDEATIDEVIHQESTKPGLTEDVTNNENTAMVDSGDVQTLNTNLPVLNNIDFVVPKGQLIGVCGSVGSGKTALLHAIMGQMETVDGSLAVRGRVAYVAQQAWIMNESLRDNILFGREFDSIRYDSVVSACNLQPDIDALPNGDKTEIGERGINLSGGQKQRVSLARAVYEEADLYLLDDPLSAVDAHVGQHIFEHCINGLMKGKTVLLSSHQLQFFEQSDHILVIKDGRIQEEGKHSELMNKKGEYEYLIKTFHSSHGDSDPDHQGDQQLTDGLEKTKTKPSEGLFDSNFLSPNIPHGSVRSRSNTVTSRTHLGHELRGSVRTRGGSFVGRSHLSLATDIDGIGVGVSTGQLYDEGSVADCDNYQHDEEEKGRLIRKETIEEGAVGLSTFFNYFRSGGAAFFFFLVFVYLCYIVLLTFSGYWLSYWFALIDEKVKSNNGTQLNTTEYDSFMSLTSVDDWEMYTLVYGFTGVLIMLVVILKTIAFCKFTTIASSVLQVKLYSKVLSSPMRVFDTTPLGRFLNIFSKDVDELDVQMPYVLENFLQYFLLILAQIITVAILFPFLLVAIAVFTVVLIGLVAFLKPCIREMKRLDNYSRSFLLSHVSTCLQGLPTLHAYRKEAAMCRKFNTVHDQNSVPLWMFFQTMRYSNICLDVVVAFLLFATAATVVLTDLPPSYAGLALAFITSIVTTFQLTVRMSIELEARCTSAERMLTYIKQLPSEAPRIVAEHRPSHDWPKGGQLTFSKVKLRYRTGLPLVINGVSFQSKVGEKIGIVGRTGSGKSSLAMALFRLVEPCSGSMEIDGMDTGSIGLDDLRSNLSIIPQDPVLFVGTIRYNLDPLDAYPDGELWKALERCELKTTVKSLKGELDAPVTENGENFSVGERQLICIARALLRHSRIIVLDEATAAIDTETDSLIQETIKECFADCTTLTIAHRLNTVMNSDRIIVMDDGKICEFASPTELLSDPESIFFQMMSIQETQKKQASSIE